MDLRTVVGPVAPSGFHHMHVLHQGSLAPKQTPRRPASQQPRRVGGLPRHSSCSRRKLGCQSGKDFGPQSALDSVLAWGDILTLTATEISSDRVPINQAGMLCSVLVLCWVGTATATGDYRYKSASNQALFGQQQVNIILAALNSSITWLMFVPVALAFYASLVSHSWMPKGPFASSPGELPAQVEVLLASLFTISTWRAIYAGLRPYI